MPGTISVSFNCLKSSLHCYSANFRDLAKKFREAKTLAQVAQAMLAAGGGGVVEICNPSPE